jgi:hypothetical protein
MVMSPRDKARSIEMILKLIVPPACVHAASSLTRSLAEIASAQSQAFLY